MTDEAQTVEARVRRETEVDMRLAGHDNKFKEINGQLVRGAQATEVVARAVKDLDRNVSELRGEIKTKDEVDKALRAEAEKTLKQQITRREFWMGVAVIVVAILSIAVNSGLL